MDNPFKRYDTVKYLDQIATVVCTDGKMVKISVVDKVKRKETLLDVYCRSLTKVVVIDATPTWEAMLPWLLTVFKDGDFKGQKTALAELTRMAQVADKYVTYVKGTESEGPEDHLTPTV